MFEIAKNTIKEFLRMKVLYIGIVIWILMIFSSYILATLTLNQDNKTILDFTLAMIEIFALLLTLSLWAYMLYNEFTQKTILLLLSRIEKKYHFILGKFIGFSAILLFIYVIMFFAFLLAIYLHHIPFEFFYIKAVFLSYMKLLVILAFVLFFSTFVSPFLALISSLAVYFVSHSTVFMYYFSTIDKEWNFSELSKFLLKMIYYILPNFQDLSMKEYILSPRLWAYTDFHFLFSIVWWALAYIVILLIFSSWIFNKKEF